MTAVFLRSFRQWSSYYLVEMPCIHARSGNFDGNPVLGEVTQDIASTVYGDIDSGSVRAKLEAVYVMNT